MRWPFKKKTKENPTTSRLPLVLTSTSSSPVPRPSQDSCSCRRPACLPACLPACPVQVRLHDRRQTGPDRWPGGVTGSPQRAQPVSTHLVLAAPSPEPQSAAHPHAAGTHGAGITAYTVVEESFWTPHTFLMYCIVLRISS